MPTEHPRKRRRTANACIACRQSKIKCSGDEPCANCQRRLVTCRFAEGGSKVLASETSGFCRRPSIDPSEQSQSSGARYLNELHHQVEDPPHPCVVSSRLKDSNSRYSGEVDEITGAESAGLQIFQAADCGGSIWQSPFTLPSMTIKNTHNNKRNWIWLAPSSTWSFTTRLAVMMTEKLHPESPRNPPAFWDGDLYNLRWQPSGSDKPPDISGLPSLDYANYLFNTVNFHLGQSYRFFDEGEFVRNMQNFYHGNALERANESRLWFVQFLLVLSFGQAFLSRSRNTSNPPGSKFFVRAMSLMPDHASLWKDSVMAIEVLALAGLYLYSIDLRESAHVYLGQAIRIAQLEGLHTQLPEDQLSAATVTRCRNLWWSLYIMDRHFSSSLGLPMITQDSDITTLLDPPITCSQEDATLSLQVRLSQLLSHILTSIYKSEKAQLGNFFDTTRSILHTMAGHAQEIERITQLKLRNSVDTLPRGTRHITLLYHQCVIIATRPLILSVLKELLQKLDQGGQDLQIFLPLTKTIMSAGIKSAVKTLQILSDEDSLLEAFLPFDLEYLYGAAIYLTMANMLFTSVSDGKRYGQEAHSILDEMVHKGNRVAEIRKAELQNLESLFGELATRVKQQGLEALTLSCPEENESRPGISPAQVQQGQSSPAYPEPDSLFIAEDIPLPCSNDPEIASSLDFLDNIGISSHDFLSIVDQIGDQDNMCCGSLEPS